jgi:hypothetical protein
MTAFSVQRSAFSVQLSAFSFQRSAFSFQRSVKPLSSDISRGGGTTCREGIAAYATEAGGGRRVRGPFNPFPITLFPPAACPPWPVCAGGFLRIFYRLPSLVFVNPAREDGDHRSCEHTHFRRVFSLPVHHSISPGHSSLSRSGKMPSRADHVNLLPSHATPRSEKLILLPRNIGLRADHLILLQRVLDSGVRHLTLLLRYLLPRADHLKLLRMHFSLRSDQISLRSDHFSLRSDHFSLRSDHFSLRSDHFSLRSDHFSLRSDQVGSRFE